MEREQSLTSFESKPTDVVKDATPGNWCDFFFLFLIPILYSRHVMQVISTLA